ncbi:MAG: ABC transporter ATP-binding protein, partial [Verrucomicrobiales bacterium]|nr:ABC transporter ATP-binding protein [Verrucomicrobiales bacterium]
MLELQNICFTIDNDGEDHDLIHQASIEVSPGHFMAIVGPSGCGKTTLLKIIAGLSEESAGAICWDGRNLSEEGDLDPTEIGYVPQFSIAYDHLTVEESIDSAVHLRVRTGKSADAHDIADRVLAQTGLEELRDRPVRVLSGGQKRRLGLAIELVSDPRLLLCDEVTSGLDPKSEAEIVSLMHDLSRGTSRIVVNVTHSLSNLELYDSVLVMFEGRVAYHGPPGALAHYFSVDNAEDIYPRLAKRSADRWHTSWSKNRGTYYKALTKLKDSETKEDPRDSGNGKGKGKKKREPRDSAPDKNLSKMDTSDASRNLASEGKRGPPATSPELKAKLAKVQNQLGSPATTALPQVPGLPTLASSSATAPEHLLTPAATSVLGADAQPPGLLPSTATAPTSFAPSQQPTNSTHDASSHAGAGLQLPGSDTTTAATL